MKNRIDPFIQSKGIVILDGALATELEARGADLNHGLWSARLLTENPQLIQQVHYDYLLSGANIITTASYQASFPGFSRHGYAHAEAIALMQLSVQLALDARTLFLQHHTVETTPLVAASVGPYGASLADGSEYRGNYGISIPALKEFHFERMKVLAESGADLLAFETIPCMDEAIALIELLKEFPGIQAWLSFSCKDEAHASSGEPFAACMNLANSSEQVIAAGVNCTPPAYIDSLIKIAVTATDKPIIVYPNKGEVWDAVQKRWITSSAHNNHFLSDAKNWYSAGATLIGGCCRTTPEDIRQLQQIAF